MNIWLEKYFAFYFIFILNYFILCCKDIFGIDSCTITSTIVIFFQVHYLPLLELFVPPHKPMSHLQEQLLLQMEIMQE